MCKILAMAGIKDSTRELAWKFVHEMTEQLTYHPERDGVGYAAMTAEGDLFGERWVNPVDAFKTRYEMSETETSMMQAYKGALAREVEYNTFGKLAPELMTSITLHTRFATSPKGLDNCHPFVSNDTSLIHNGVIINVRELEYHMSTCDSEGILHAYLNANVDTQPEMIQEACQQLNGSYACAVLGFDGETHYMDVFKGDSTSLFVARIRELETTVYCTNPIALKKGCDKLGLTVECGFWMRGGHFVRANQATGEILQVLKFDPDYVPPVPESGGVTSMMGYRDLNDEEIDRPFTREEIIEMGREDDNRWKAALLRRSRNKA